MFGCRERDKGRSRRGRAVDDLPADCAALAMTRMIASLLGLTLFCTRWFDAGCSGACSLRGTRALGAGVPPWEVPAGRLMKSNASPWAARPDAARKLLCGP